MLKMYCKDSSCPKCGAMGAHTSFRKADTFIRESMVRTCVRCGYIWFEKPLDTNEEEGE